MINWLLGLDNLKDRIELNCIEQLKKFLIKEDLNYIETFLQESKSVYYDQINQISFWTKFYIWYQANTFIHQLDQLIDELQTTKILLKKCLLCECEIETLILNWSIELSSLNSSRTKLYKDLVDYFKMMRTNCHSISEIYERLNDKLFNDNQISKLPIDTFDNILETDDFNYVKLKSLVQMIKLEISELLVLIIFYYSINNSDFYDNLKILSSFLDNLIKDTKKTNQKINEDCFYFTKYFVKNQEDGQLNRTKINPSQNEILFNLKTAKTKICSSLLMIENGLNSILSDKFETDKFDNDKIIAELTSAIETLNLIVIKRKPRINQFIHKQDQQINDCNQIDSKANQIELDKSIPEYEVFEAYIEEDREIERYVEKFENYTFENAKYPESLYGELKEVLDVKAKDHRTREAKALGINENDLPEQITKRTDKKSRTVSENVFINPLPQMPFNLIQLTNENSKKPNFLLKEENFGDDLSSSEE